MSRKDSNLSLPEGLAADDAMKSEKLPKRIEQMVREGADAAEAKHADKGKQEQVKDPLGPRIPCERLQFVTAMTMPNGSYGGSLEAARDPRRKQVLIDYLPRLQFYEVTYIPAPGSQEKPVTELYPREFASYRPA